MGFLITMLLQILILPIMISLFGFNRDIVTFYIELHKIDAAKENTISLISAFCFAIAFNIGGSCEIFFSAR
jgi:hypothetical protein